MLLVPLPIHCCAGCSLDLLQAADCYWVCMINMLRRLFQPYHGWCMACLCDIVNVSYLLLSICFFPSLQAARWLRDGVLATGIGAWGGGTPHLPSTVDAAESDGWWAGVGAQQQSGRSAGLVDGCGLTGPQLSD